MINDPQMPIFDEMRRRANRIVDDLVVSAALGTEKKFSDEDYDWAQSFLKATTPPIEYFGY